MRTNFILWLLAISVSQTCYGQTPVTIFESKLKIPGVGSETFYYGFAEGDQLVFSFHELEGKELKEIEIVEMPGSSKFMDYKTSAIKEKVIKIQRTAIYQFRFQNSALRGRVCQIEIKRIPASPETQNFNTTVYWRTEIDATYTPTIERFLVRTDTIVTVLTNQTAKVSSQNAANGNLNKNLIDVVLPENTASWSYYIGVGTEGKAAYEDAKKDFTTVASKGLVKLTGYEPVALLAIAGINLFDKVQGRDNVKYYFISDWNNAQSFMSGNTFLQYKQGDVVNDASQMKFPLSGKVILGLANDNILEPIEVIVKITAVQLRQSWETRTVNKLNIAQREVGYLRN